MRQHGLFFAAAAVALMAASGFAQTKLTLNLQIGGTNRNCIVHIPPGTSKPALVFFIHGATGSGGAFETETKGDVTADREKFIAAYPSASSDGASGTWQDMSGTGNFPFFKAVIDTVDALYKIDRNKIYMTGFSQGGFISYAAACFYSDIYAAVAPVSGHTNTTCALKRLVPIFMTFGAAEGASSFLTDLNAWLKLDSCPSTQTIIKPYPASMPNSKAVRVSYGPCKQGTSVIMDSIIGQPHQWPSASNLNQADEVWAFFKQYSLNSTTGIHTQPAAASASHEPLFVSYAAGRIQLGGIDKEVRVQVSDTRGLRVATGITSQHQFFLRGKPSGVYLLTIDEGARMVARKFVIP